MPRLIPLLLVLSLVGWSCSLMTPTRELDGEPAAKVFQRTPAPMTIPTPAVTPEPVATPTPTPTPTPLARAHPLVVGVEEVRVANGHNGALFGAAPVAPDPGAANRAVDASAAVLSRFLEAQFVARETYWSAAGLASLLDPATADETTQAALGVLDGVEVLGTVSGSASAVADVVMEGEVVHAVTLTYAATVELILPEASGPVSHTGVITFTPLQGELVLAGIQPTTTFGGDLMGVLS